MFTINIIKKTNIIELYIFKYWDEKTAGTIIKKINGLVIPPVKKNRTPSCNISKLNYTVAKELFNWFVSILKFR